MFVLLFYSLLKWSEYYRITSKRCSHNLYCRKCISVLPLYQNHNSFGDFVKIGKSCHFKQQDMRFFGRSIFDSMLFLFYSPCTPVSVHLKVLANICKTSFWILNERSSFQFSMTDGDVKVHATMLINFTAILQGLNEI